MRKAAITLSVLGLLVGASSSGAAPLSVRDSFRIGTSGTSYCSAQVAATDPALSDMFDVGYSVTCRDAALPIGKLYVLRAGAEASSRLMASRKDITCSAAHPGSVEEIGAVEVVDCKLADADVAYRVYEYRKGNLFYSAEGLAGYDSALRLGLRSIVADRQIEGEVSIATTGIGDPASFARVQAGTLDPTRALTEAYRRNNVGNYADAAEFFAAVSSAGNAPISRAEALINEALQKSNLGRYAEADSLFSRAGDQVQGDPLDARRLRNYRAMHLLNQGQPGEALKEIDKPVAPMARVAAATGGSDLGIDTVTAERLNSESNVGGQLGSSSDELLPEEKAEILDAQALQLRGTSQRLADNFAGAASDLRTADSKLQAVRGGRVASVAWMRAQIAGDLAAIAEHEGNGAEADRLYRQGVAILEANYPGSAALLNARARLAGHLARSGQLDAAEAMFADIVHSQADVSNLPPSFARVLRPYVDILLKKDNPAAAAEIFSAMQLMMRPGLAQTQAVLARQLSGGTDEASRLFRQTVTLSRQVERARISLAHYDDIAKPSPEEVARAAALKSELEQAQKEEVASQSALASFPRYRAVSGEVISLPDLQKGLRPGEAYYKMTIVDDGIYAFLATPTSAKVTKLPISAEALDGEVTSLRETISTIDRGRQVTYAFDVPLAHKLYTDLFGPFDSELSKTTHLIFEPDGAMLRLPANLLIVDQASADLYKRRVEANPNDDFNFTGIKWFGRDRDISTAVSPRSFVNLRNAPPSSGARAYLGLGSNTKPPANAASVIPAAADRDCILPIATWENPISGRELDVAGDILSKANAQNVQIITGDGFTDTALEQRSDLNQYRIIHFATHGVVTAPRPKCPTQPALLTSFGGKGSDGLLTFREIFDLHLDADIVILSACDTAGGATALATQSAGLATGGDVALDGLVRAFVGAGGRLVVASHWPVPDDFNATERLITGLFTAPPGTPTVTALRLSEQKLMDDPDTSHPFYWSAFAAVGDGDIPVIRAETRIAQKP